MDVCCAFAWDDVGLRLNPYPARYRPAFASSILPSPHAHRRSLRSAFPFGGHTGVTPFRLTDDMGGLGSAYPPAALLSAYSQDYKGISRRLAILARGLSASFGPFGFKAFISSSHVLAIPPQPGSPTA